MVINKVAMDHFGKKRFLSLAICLLSFFPLAFSQSANAVYLKDGSRIIGQILELDSLGGVRIMTQGAIYRYGDVFRWKFSNTELSDKNYDRYFDDDLYHTYVGGSNQFNIGGACWLYGLTCLVLTVLEFDPKADHQSGRFFAYAGGANALICLGCVFTGIGKRRLDWVERTFNAQNAADNELSLSPSLLMTPQYNLGLGATLSFNF